MLANPTVQQVTNNAVVRASHFTERGFQYDDSTLVAEIVRQSALAEKYAADYFSAEYHNIDTYAGDGGYDFRLKSGRTVDVKWLGFLSGTTIPRLSGRIIVSESKGLKADIYLAVVGSQGTGFTIAGWCTKDELLAAPRFIGKQRADGSSSNYAMPTEKLHPVKKK